MTGSFLLTIFAWRILPLACCSWPKAATSVLHSVVVVSPSHLIDRLNDCPCHLLQAGTRALYRHSIRLPSSAFVPVDVVAFGSFVSNPKEVLVCGLCVDHIVKRRTELASGISRADEVS